MLKSEFVDVVANVMQTSKAKAKVAVDGVFEALFETLTNGESVEVYGLGKFDVVDTKPRTAFNFKTGETVEIPSRKSMRFRPSKVLKQAMAQLR